MRHERQPSLFIPHGAGPAFFMPFGPFTPAMWADTSAYLQGVAAGLPARPRALVVVSAHWQAAAPRINGASVHSLYYDYYGGSAAAYALQYAAKGDPELAVRIGELLAADGIASEAETQRGLDHGVFLPFMLMFPDAGIPIVQISLDGRQDPATHVAIGRALLPLRDEGVLIVGSGMSFHNPAILADGLKGIVDAQSLLFDAWLAEAMASDAPEREAALIAWEEAPAARHAHPEAEHLLPLHVAAGAGGADRGRQEFRGSFLGAAFSAFRFG